jgi:hypothetical protein
MKNRGLGRIGIATAAWAAIIFATSCRFIERRVFIDFVKKYIPAGMPQDLWVSFWQLFGIFVVKAYHVAEFALLCGLLYTLFRRSLAWQPRRAVIAAATIAVLYAISDEWHQTFIPGRGGTWVDVMIDGAGIGIAVAWVLWKSRTARRTRE